MDSENHSQALSYVSNGYFLTSYIVVVVSRAQICSAVSPKNDKLHHLSSVAPQKKKNNPK